MTSLTQQRRIELGSELVAGALIGLTRTLIGGQARYLGPCPGARQTIFYANHTSNVDALALWSALPGQVRRATRPVAARDYWGQSRLRRFFAIGTLHAVLIDRKHELDEDPLEPLRQALRQQDSLIIFPEGTRGSSDIVASFKSGLYWLSREFPQVDIVPVYLHNLHRCLPKGASVPRPVDCDVHFGAPLDRIADEAKEAFLDRARRALMELK
jgi:1-acyl-sn-glycerol-3-phosphate acyltransferase